jgi:hypothetical protein
LDIGVEGRHHTGALEHGRGASCAAVDAGVEDPAVYEASPSPKHPQIGAWNMLLGGGT